MDTLIDTYISIVGALKFDVKKERAIKTEPNLQIEPE